MSKSLHNFTIREIPVCDGKQYGRTVSHNALANILNSSDSENVEVFTSLVSRAMDKTPSDFNVQTNCPFILGNNFALVMGLTPLNFAAALINAGVGTQKGFDELKLLIEEILNKVNSLQLSIKDDAGFTTLHWMLEFEDTKILNLICQKMKEQKVLIDEQDNTGRSALSWVFLPPIDQDCERVVKLATVLISHDADIYLKSTDKLSPIEKAVGNPKLNSELINITFKHMKEEDKIKSMQEEDTTNIVKACFKLICNFLATERSVAENKFKEHVQVVIKKLPEMSELIKKCLDVNNVFEALKIQSIGIIEQLLKTLGLNINGKDTNGDSILHRAIKDETDPNFCEALITKLCYNTLNTDNSGNTPVQLIIIEPKLHTKKRAEYIDVLYKHGGITANDKELANNCWPEITNCFNDNDTFNVKQAIEIIGSTEYLGVYA